MRRRIVEGGEGVEGGMSENLIVYSCEYMLEGLYTGYLENDVDSPGIYNEYLDGNCPFINPLL